MKIRLYNALAAIITTFTIAWGFGIGSATAAEAPKKIVIGYASIAPHQAPVWIAYEAGFFRKYGLDVQLLFVESGSLSVQTLVSGDVTAANTSGAAVIQSNLQGSGVVLIAGFLNTFDYKFMVSHDITRPDQLKGKVVAVSRIGSSSDFATRYALDKYGLIPDKDVSVIQIGSQPARFAALQTGKIHAVMVSIPVTAKAAKMGFNTLADLQMLGLEYQQNSLAVSEKVIKAQPDLVRSILKAHVEAIYYAKTHRKEAIAILAKYLKTDDADALEEAYEACVLTLIPQKPYPSIKGIQTILREFGIKNPVARAAKPEQFVDISFMKELDSSGFIDQLYKSSAVVKATPNQEPVSTKVVVKENTPPVENKAKAVAADEKAKSESKTVVASTDKASATTVKSMQTVSAANQQYIVKGGDTLSRLSERFYNSADKWEKIFEANRETVKNPNYIYVGMKLMIPPEA